jgi:hypothetical protein
MQIQLIAKGSSLAKYSACIDTLAKQLNANNTAMIAILRACFS